MFVAARCSLMFHIIASLVAIISTNEPSVSESQVLQVVYGKQYNSSLRAMLKAGKTVANALTDCVPLKEALEEIDKAKNDPEQKMPNPEDDEDKNQKKWDE